MMQFKIDVKDLNEEVLRQSVLTDMIRDEMKRVVIGQNRMVDRLLIGLLCNGHILLEGVPGLAKTLTIKSMAKTIEAPFSRIQFTPDLLPADIIGTLVFNQQKNEFVVRKGPIFSNFILADEVNRAPAKVQSALLEAMQEKQVTIGGHSYPLAEPFLVLATQNPLEQEGTYALPEAQADRFMLKVQVGYPTKEEEQLIIRQQSQPMMGTEIRTVATVKEVMAARSLVKKIYLDEKIEKYIVEIVSATREPDKHGLRKLKNHIDYGGSPRAGISLALSAKAHAFMEKRGYVIPDDIKAMAHDVLRHRIGLSYEAEADNISTVNIIDEVLKTVKVP